MLAIEMIPKIFVIMAWTMVIGVQGDTENPVASDGSSGGDSFTEEFFTEIGNNVDLRCRLNGASFEWKRENGEAVPDKSFQAGRILRIPNVERSDEGRYVCTDDNGRIQYVKLVIAELRYKCYYWTDEDRVKMLQGGSINSNSNSIFEIERRICEGYENFVFTQGVDSKAPGCGNCRCCQPDNPDFIVGNVDTRCAMEALIMNIEDCRWAATAFNKTFNWGTKVKTYYTSGKTMVGSCYMDQHNDVYFKNVNYDFMSPLTKPICRRKETLEKKAKDEMFKEMIQTISTAKENKAQIQENKVQITYLKKKVKTVVVYGQWGMWSDSSTCSKSCGTGQKTRIRTCIQSPSTGELPCRGISSESINCNTESCPDNIVRDSQNDNKKCGEANSSHRLFRLNGKDANKNNCIAKCAKNEDCVAFSGIWNQWCIGCDVKLTTKHQGAIAFKKDTDIVEYDEPLTTKWCKLSKAVDGRNGCMDDKQCLDNARGQCDKDPDCYGVSWYPNNVRQRMKLCLSRDMAPKNDGWRTMMKSEDSFRKYPGCWIRLPSGCPNQKSRPQYDHYQNTINWYHHTFNGASNSRVQCLARKRPLNNWCGVDDIIVEYLERD